MNILLAALNSKFVQTNIAIRYIKSYCSEFEIDIREYTINDSLYSITSDIYHTGARIVGFSCYIWNIDAVLKVCSNLKKIDNDIIIILGGPEVSFDCREFMKSHEFVDYIIKGEGESSSKLLFSYLSGDNVSMSQIKGLVYRDNDCIMENGEADLITELDSIPFPYSDDESFENKIVYYESSRGCPFNCSYCLSSTIKGVRFFSIDRVKKDLLWFINKNVSLVKFVDRTFNCSNHYFEIFKFLVDNRKNTRFHFEISADILDEKLIQFLNTVPKGLFQLEIGVQSTNESTLGYVNRKSDLSKLSHNIIKLRHPDNIHLHLDLIAGLPGEGLESFTRSFNHVFSLKPHMLQLGFLKVLKGSSIRKDTHRYGIVFTEYPPYEVLKTSDISFSELTHLKNIEDTVDRYYNSGRFSTVIKYLSERYASAFNMFESISKYEIMNGYGRKNISNVGQYELLYNFCKDTGRGDRGIFRECLAFDYLMQGRNPVVPDFLKTEMIVDNQYLWNFLSNEDNIKKFLPQYTGISAKKIIKNVYVRHFSFDICTYIDNGKIDTVDKYVIFDYTHKDKKVNYLCI